MSRYIDADELIFIGLDNPDDDHLFEFVPKEFIDNAPTADVVEVVHGEWIDHSENGYVECPFCHSITTCDDNIEELHFCFSCGAKLRGGTE